MTTSKAKQKRSKLLLRILTNRFFVCSVLAGILGALAFWRNPTYLTAPNFYAEDGTVFAQTILDKGFLAALFTPFNGYFICGIYILEGLAFVVNFLLGSGSILDQPAAVAIVSYAFWGIVCSLPALLFWRDIRHKNWLIALCVLLALLPLPSFDYAILGTIGNYKFAFVFIAFLLLIKRHRLAPGSRWFYAIDAALVVCALTNATTYLLLPFALIRYLPRKWKSLATGAWWRELFTTKSVISLIIMGALTASQIVFVVLHGGADQLKGYLDQPFEWAKTIEIFIERTYLFPFTHLLGSRLNDVIVVGLFAGLLIGLIKIARRQDRSVLYFGIYATFVTTALFASQRTGVSQFFQQYTTSGTDHFFYAQNWIFLTTVLFVVMRTADVARMRWRIAVAVCLTIIGASMAIRNDFGQDVTAERSVGTFWQGAQKGCTSTHGDIIQVPIYPYGAHLTMPLPSQVCNDRVARYIPPRETLPLAPANNNYVRLDSALITQTFVATHDQLSGVSVFFSTFGARSHSTYNLTIFDATCRNTVRTTTFSASDIADNAYADIRVSPIADSKGKQYCFGVSPTQLQQGRPPLAEQLSLPDIYKEGTAFKNDTPLTEDVVFDILYR